MSKYVKISELAEYLGVSVHAVRSWVRNGKLPSATYFRVGNTYRFNLKMIEEGFVTGVWSEKTPESEPEPEYRQPEQLLLLEEDEDDYTGELIDDAEADEAEDFFNDEDK